MSRGALTIVFVVCACAAATARASPWEGMAESNHRRCTKLADDVSKLGDAREVPRALQQARAAVAMCPSDRLVLQRAGETLLAAREYAEARPLLERARRLADRAPATHDADLSLAFHLGFVREVTGDIDGAIEEHRRLEAMGGLPTPNQYLVHYNLGDELMATGRLAEAIEEYRRAVLLAPGKPVVRLALAVALDRDEQVDQSRAELTAALAFDPELRSLAANDYVFVPAADAYYYRALALLERGSMAEARQSLRAFIAALPNGSYTVRARQRLAEAEQRVDARELDVSSGAVDKRSIAQALGPAVGALEACLPTERVVQVRLLLARGTLRAEPEHPLAECFDRALSRVDATLPGSLKSGAVMVPLGGRRAAASPR